MFGMQNMMSLTNELLRIIRNKDTLIQSLKEDLEYYANEENWRRELKRDKKGDPQYMYHSARSMMFRAIEKLEKLKNDT